METTNITRFKFRRVNHGRINKGIKMGQNYQREQENKEFESSKYKVDRFGLIIKEEYQEYEDFEE
jgi:hypothetical protein